MKASSRPFRDLIPATLHWHLIGNALSHCSVVIMQEVALLWYCLSDFALCNLSVPQTLVRTTCCSQCLNVMLLIKLLSTLQVLLLLDSQ